MGRRTEEGRQGEGRGASFFFLGAKEQKEERGNPKHPWTEDKTFHSSIALSSGGVGRGKRPRKRDNAIILAGNMEGGKGRKEGVHSVFMGQRSRCQFHFSFREAGVQEKSPLSTSRSDREKEKRGRKEGLHNCPVPRKKAQLMSYFRSLSEKKGAGEAHKAKGRREKGKGGAIVTHRHEGKKSICHLNAEKEGKKKIPKTT